MEESLGIRLQKFLASRGCGSRRSIEDLIRDGKITVDKQKAVLGQRVEGFEDIRVNGKKIDPQKPETTWIAFYKPVGVESTCSVSRHAKERTLESFDFGAQRLFPVGRLDKESQGLLLMTNDGEIANKLMHPRYAHEKEYEVRVHKAMMSSDIKKLAQGVEIGGKKTQPCRVARIDEKSFIIILKEGRNRQIRKMCEALGLEVTYLLRTRVQNITLKGLKSGEWKKIRKISLTE